MAFVQLSEDGVAVIALFSCPQDPEYWPRQTEIPDSDKRIAAFLKSSNINEGAELLLLEVN